jgi:hypothetical protein
MSTTALWNGILLIALVLCGVGLGWRLQRLLACPSHPDRAALRGAAWRGILYAFAWGMMPWAKESVRHHFLPYVRGGALPHQHLRHPRFPDRQPMTSCAPPGADRCRPGAYPDGRHGRVDRHPDADRGQTAPDPEPIPMTMQRWSW